MTKQAFRVWLQEHLDDIFVCANSEKCPLATAFMCTVHPTTYVIDGELRDLPKWAVEFVYHLDYEYAAPFREMRPTGRQALRILDTKCSEED